MHCTSTLRLVVLEDLIILSRFDNTTEGGSAAFWMQVYTEFVLFHLESSDVSCCLGKRENTDTKTEVTNIYICKFYYLYYFFCWYIYFWSNRNATKYHLDKQIKSKGAERVFKSCLRTDSIFCFIIIMYNYFWQNRQLFSFLCIGSIFPVSTLTLLLEQKMKGPSWMTRC